jgi:uncharacterized membrane-anchored protein YhcB (DUF1043 family)
VWIGGAAAAGLVAGVLVTMLVARGGRGKSKASASNG